MKAVVVSEFGPPDRYALEDTPTPAPKPGEVAIAVKAAGISFVDMLVAQGKYQIQPPLPFVPGTELAGIVSAVGDGVSAVKPGDRVAANTLGGAYAETCCCPAGAVAKMPEGMSFEHGAVFGISYSTAYYAMKQRAQLQPGETMLALGAAGAIGTACVQVAKAFGARVIASASTEAKRALARDCGADEAIDSGAEDWRAQIKALTGGKGVDVIADPVGGSITEKAFRSLAWKGRHLVLGYAEGAIPALPVNLALLKGSALVGVDFRQFNGIEPEASRQNLAALFELYAKGAVTPPIAAARPLAEFKAAMQDVIDQKHVGRVVLTMA